MKIWSRALPFLLSAALLLSGCSSREMKGTPFYTGEYEINVPGADEGRVNVWPLAYYRAPALSVLWPLYEQTEEHVAVRPLYSAYGDTRDYWEHNVLWPLGQINTRKHANRLFPYYWGETKRPGDAQQDYHVFFPLFWHYEDELNTLLPLWYIRHSEWEKGEFTEHDYWLGGPLSRFYSSKHRSGWHVTLFSHYRDDDAETDYAGYPYPLAFSWRDKKESGYVTPLYARSEYSDGDLSEGWAAIPPLLSLRTWSTSDDDLWLCGPLARYRTGADMEAWHAALFGRYHCPRDGSTYTGFPWPLLFSWETRRERGLFTPLYAREERVGGDAPCGRSVSPLLLSWHSWSKNDDAFWLFGPLAHYRTGSEAVAWHATLFGRYYFPREDATYSGYPWPLFFSWQTRREHGLFTPLYAYQEDSANGSSGGFSMLPPLLSWHTWKTNDTGYWLLGPLAQYRAGTEAEAWRVALFGRYHYPKADVTYAGYPWPLAWSWRTRQEHGFFSPVYAYKESNSDNVVDGWGALPFLLAWHAWSQSESDFYALLGLFSEQRRSGVRSGHLLPLYTYSQRAKSLYTPLFGWNDPDASAPSGYWYPLTPLLGVRTGATQGGWFFPLYSHREYADRADYSTQFLLLGYASQTRSKTRTSDTLSTESGFFPLYSRSYQTFSNRVDDCGTRTEGYSRDTYGMILGYSSSGVTATYAPRGEAPPVGTNVIERMRHDAWTARKKQGDRITTQASSGVFPIWMSTSRGEKRPDGSVLSDSSTSMALLILYDTKRESSAPAGSAPLDYERRRILWRVWHYERRSGDVSVDLFPFITHDTHADGFRKTSFLWRFYRYEKSREGKASLDLLFLPLLRD